MSTKAFGHAMQTKRMKLIEGRMCQHVCSPNCNRRPADVGLDDRSSVSGPVCGTAIEVVGGNGLDGARTRAPMSIARVAAASSRSPP